MDRRNKAKAQLRVGVCFTARPNCFVKILNRFPGTVYTKLHLVSRLSIRVNSKTLSIELPQLSQSFAIDVDGVWGFCIVVKNFVFEVFSCRAIALVP